METVDYIGIGMIGAIAVLAYVWKSRVGENGVEGKEGEKEPGVIGSLMSTFLGR